MTFNQQLKKLREDAELTQEELALRLNISRSAIAKWEQGKGMPSLDLLKSLALFFHVSIDALLGEEGIKLYESSRTKKNMALVGIAVLALVIATVSTTLFAIEKNRQINETSVTSLVQVSSVSYTNQRFTLKYEDNNKIKSFSFGSDLLSFRSLDIGRKSVQSNDYVLLSHKGAIVESVVVIDNPTLDATKGYQLSFKVGEETYTYYDYDYYVTENDHGINYSQSNIRYFENRNTVIDVNRIQNITYYYTHISHTVYVNNALDNLGIMSIYGVAMDQYANITKVNHSSSAAGLQHLSRLSFSIDGYENRIAGMLGDLPVRDYIYYDIDLVFIQPNQQVLIKEYDDNDALIEETTITDATTAAAYELNEDTAYLRYYLDGNLRFRTLEVGESETIFIDDGTPLMTAFKLEIR